MVMYFLILVVVNILCVDVIPGTESSNQGHTFNYFSGSLQTGSPSTSSPGGRYGVSSSVVGSEVFFFGGRAWWDDGGDLEKCFSNEMWKFEAATKTWTYLSGECPGGDGYYEAACEDHLNQYQSETWGSGYVPPERKFHSSVAVGSVNQTLLIMFGGKHTPKNDVWEYEIRSSRWRCRHAIAPLIVYGNGSFSVDNHPEKRFFHLAHTVLEGEKYFVYVMMGCSTDSRMRCLNTVWKYDWLGNSFRYIRGYHGFDSIGVYPHNGGMNVFNDTLQPAARGGSISWVNGPRIYIYSGKIRNSSLLFDDFGEAMYITDFWVFDTVSESFALLFGGLMEEKCDHCSPDIVSSDAIPGGRAGGVAIGNTEFDERLQDFLFFYGGSVAISDYVSGDFWRYSISQQVWTFVGGIKIDVDDWSGTTRQYSNFENSETATLGSMDHGAGFYSSGYLFIGFGEVYNDEDSAVIWGFGSEIVDFLDDWEIFVRDYLWIVVVSIIVVVFALFVLIICMISIFVCVSKKKKTSKPNKHVSTLEMLDRVEKRGVTQVMAKLDVNKSLFQIEMNDIQVKEMIGSGGFAKVFSANYAGMSVAFKVFDTSLLVGDSDGSNYDFEMFESELKLFSALNHRNIPRFYGASLKPPRTGLVMELCSNGNLQTYTTKNSVTVDERLDLLRGVVEGMVFLHSKRVIHRDLKPENVLISEDKISKICDFGLSRMDEKSAKTQAIGSNMFMAPEVLLSGEYDSKVDVFSFGMILFCVISLNYNPFGKLSMEVQVKMSNNASYRPDMKLIDKETRKKYRWLPSLIEQCWNGDSKKRPTFKQIQKIMGSNK